MELPVVLAMDTTLGWERGTTVLASSELALEDAGKDESDGREIKYLLIGDGKPSGPNAKRLRATPELIAGLPETLKKLAELIQDEIKRAQAKEDTLEEKIENREVFHEGDFFKGSGTQKDPLRLVQGNVGGITSKVKLIPDGEKNTFSLPADFVYEKLEIVTINGLSQEPEVDYVLAMTGSFDESASPWSVVFPIAPDAQDKVSVYYTGKGAQE